MQTGDRIRLTITDLAYGGDGVGRAPDGRAVFAPFSAVGDDLEVTVCEVRKRHARAHISEVLAAGPGREAPACPLFGACGGCCYQHLDYAVEAAAKQRQFGQLLRRIGGVNLCGAGSRPPALALAPAAYGYRNKLVLEPLAAADGTPDFGFHALDAAALLPVGNCPLAAPEINALLPAAKQTALAAAGDPPHARDRLLLRKPALGPARAFPATPPREDEWLDEEWLGRPIKVPAHSFWQTNPAVAAALAHHLMATFDAEPADVLIDAYAGAGAFSLAIGARVRNAILIETDRAALDAARRNHRDWELAGRSFRPGATERLLRPALDELGAHRARTVVILDPPRGGCEAAALEALLASPVRTVLYVSCNPATLARDLRTLAAPATYRVTHAAWADMFPRTAHFECVVRLDRVLA
ncbi:MAG: 23S rRNA (uracil(1939)-C(5))-methyltransferase RlmD [Lentisphaerae bacterium ADurb.BinA184]|nr:MAG: 23S rRNA (uracil(1939)-C(5))-methyltransferase RlmD [Lentisphaerae bacterium ADurb.BinA184]